MHNYFFYYELYEFYELIFYNGFKRIRRID